MEVSNFVTVRFINLTETLILNCLLNRFAINLGIKCQFYRINDIFIKLS